MKTTIKYVFFIIILAFIMIGYQTYGTLFPWLHDKAPNTLTTIAEIPAPKGYMRVSAESHTFATWLRQLPLKMENNHVYLYNGQLKDNQRAHYKVLAIDVGTQDLQQCADAIIRLRSEYLFSRKRYDQIAFNFTSGDRASFLKWVEGYRPQVKGNKVTWKKYAKKALSYNTFRSYLNTVFMYAGSYSLSKELQVVRDLKHIQIGDVFIQGGFPGHAILVADMATSKHGSKTAILLAQSFMPAQEIHVLRNPSNKQINPWYIVNETERLYTPEWTFEWSELKRFK